MQQERGGYVLEEPLSSGARELYRKVVEAGGAICLHESEPLRDELVQAGLLAVDPQAPAVYVAVDPQRLASRQAAALHAQAVTCLQRAARLPTDYQELADAFSATRAPQHGGPVERVSGMAEINRRLAEVLASCTSEMLTAQPGGPRSAATLERAIPRDLEVLKHGARVRTLYQPSTRQDKPTRDYVAAMTQAGAHIRTLNESFKRLIVVDSRVAVFPVDDDREQAVFCRDEGVVSYLVTLFNLAWERGYAFTGSRDAPPEVVESFQQSILELLDDGLPHKAIANRLGVSDRTMARHLEQLQAKFGVETMYQLGVAVGRNRA